MGTEDLEKRRPLKSRASRWAGALAAFLTRSGVTPNAISLASVAFATLAGAGILMTLWVERPASIALWTGAAFCIQLRLVCNLMDGMVAVEGGKGGPCGEIFNDFPDRVADVAIFACAGYATGCVSGEVLGWLCACGAVATAYVRVLGTALCGSNDFRGIMAKPQRMAAMTAVCAGQVFDPGVTVLWVGLGAVGCGLVVTIAGRLRRLGNLLKGAKP